jgi:hypothetical protein
MTHPRLAIPFLVLLAAAGCVSAEATFVGPHANLAPVPEEDVRVFLASDSVPANCTRLAIINLAGSASSTTEAQMIRAAKRRTGKIGGNAVHLGETRNPRASTQVAAAILGPAVRADRKSEAMAYVCSEQTGMLRRLENFFGLGD